MTEMITVRGRFTLYGETGTEGFYWAVEDARGTHGEVGACPWDGGRCPGTRAYWEAVDASEDEFVASGGWKRLFNVDPPTHRQTARRRHLGHSSYYSIWVLNDGEHLRVWHPSDRLTLVLDWDVALEQQADQYADGAKSARGLIIHAVPIGVDLDWFSDLALNGAPAEVSFPASDSARGQDARLDELAALTRAAEGRQA